MHVLSHSLDVIFALLQMIPERRDLGFFNEKLEEELCDLCRSGTSSAIHRVIPDVKRTFGPTGKILLPI
jgi:hypothetical protein